MEKRGPKAPDLSKMSAEALAAWERSVRVQAILQARALTKSTGKRYVVRCQVIDNVGRYTVCPFYTLYGEGSVVDEAYLYLGAVVQGDKLEGDSTG